MTFIGQTPVKVMGTVRAGDYLITSGRHDGMAEAVAPEAITLEHLPLLIGTAWESAGSEGMALVNTAIGLDHGAVVARASANLHARLAVKDQRIEDMQGQIADMQARLDALEALEAVVSRLASEQKGSAR